ncbi:hypothetical protein ACMFMF_006341 [Clarireedia jacksonii]
MFERQYESVSECDLGFSSIKRIICIWFSSEASQPGGPALSTLLVVAANTLEVGIGLSCTPHLLHSVIHKITRGRTQNRRCDIFVYICLGLLRKDCVDRIRKCMLPSLGFGS